MAVCTAGQIIKSIIVACTCNILSHLHIPVKRPFAQTMFVSNDIVLICTCHMICFGKSKEDIAIIHSRYCARELIKVLYKMCHLRRLAPVHISELIKITNEQGSDANL